MLNEKERVRKKDAVGQSQYFTLNIHTHSFIPSFIHFYFIPISFFLHSPTYTHWFTPLVILLCNHFSYLHVVKLEDLYPHEDKDNMHNWAQDLKQVTLELRTILKNAFIAHREAQINMWHCLIRGLSFIWVKLWDCEL